jgi:hypothetical protein
LLLACIPDLAGVPLVPDVLNVAGLPTTGIAGVFSIVGVVPAVAFVLLQFLLN